jgi:hypothetical protein
MIYPTGVATPGIRKKKQEASASQVGGPAGGGFVAGSADSVAEMAQGGNQEAPSAETVSAGQTSVQQQNSTGGKIGDAPSGYAPPPATTSPASADGVQQGRDAVQDQGRNPGKLGALPSSIGTPPPAPPVDDGPRRQPGKANSVDEGFYDYEDSISPNELAGQNIDENNLDELAYLRALGLLGGGNPVTDEELANTRAMANRAGADEVRRQRALFGGSGFGASGLAAGALSDAQVSAALQTEQAVSDLQASGRQEQLQNILAGAQLGQTQRGSRVDAERNRLIMDILRDQYLGDDPVSDATRREGESMMEEAQRMAEEEGMTFAEAMDEVQRMKALREQTDRLLDSGPLGELEGAWYNLRDWLQHG